MPDSSITKKALAGAVKELMRTKPLQKISVGDICQACDMNRKSFYYHFKDKYDLINWVFYTEFVERLMAQEKTDGWSFLLSICQYFHANRAFYVCALEQTGQNSFSEYFTDILRPILNVHYSSLLLDDDAHDFMTTFFTDAFLCAIKRWLHEDALPPERFAELIWRTTQLHKPDDVRQSPI